MSQCKKFAPNIFNKTKCSNCFRQKEEHSAVALECNRASRTTTRSGYLFLAPDWDFSVPLNRTKRWQRRWFVLYDDGELSYSVDEHPDTIPQGSVDMSQVVEVTSAEQLTGHPHSLALTAPDRVTFVKAASREEARWWLELLAVLPRRHKRNATFPGGRASPSLPHLGRSASPQPPRPLRHLVTATAASEGGGSPRTNFTTPPLKEERDPNAMTVVANNNNTTTTSPLASIGSSYNTSSTSSFSSSRCSLVAVLLKEDVTATQVASNAKPDTMLLDGPRPTWVPKASAILHIGAEGGGGARDTISLTPHSRTEYLVSSGSPPTRDKLRCEDKVRARRDWRHERLRDIATALTDRSPESSLVLPAEGLLHLKKGWLWHRESVSIGGDAVGIADEQWRRRWWVLCGPSLLGYRNQDDEESGGAPLLSVELASVTGYGELRSDGPRFGFQVLRTGGASPLTLSAVTTGIRSNWLQALRKAAPGMIESPTPLDPLPATITSSNSSVPSSTSSSRHSTASSSQLNAIIIDQRPTNSSSSACVAATSQVHMRSCRLSTGSSSGIGTPTTPRSSVCSGGGVMFSSDEEYRTASEGGRRDSMTDVDWMDCPGIGGGSGSSMVKNLLNRSKDQRIQQQQRSLRPHKLPRSQPTTTSSRQSTLDNNVSSPDELDCASSPSSPQHHHIPYSAKQQQQHEFNVAPSTHSIHHQQMRTRKLHLQLHLDDSNGIEAEGERRRVAAMEKELEMVRTEVHTLEAEASRLQGLLSEAASKEMKGRDTVYALEKIEQNLTLKLEKLLRDQKSFTRRLAESDEAIRESDERSATLNRELQTKQRIVASLQEELTCANERCAASRLENDRLYKKLQERNTTRTTTTPTITPLPPLAANITITQLINIDLDGPLHILSHIDLTRHCLDLRARFERAVAEIRELQRRLRDAQAHLDAQQLERLRFGQRVDAARTEYDGRLAMLRDRVEDLTGKLVIAERQIKGGVRARTAQREGSCAGNGGNKVGRRSLSLKGRESFSVSKDLEDKVTLLEAKLLSLEQQQQPVIVDKSRCARRSKTVMAGGSNGGRRSTDNGSPIDDRSLRRLRRKSLDGAPGTEPLKLLGRLNALEEKMALVVRGEGDADTTGVDDHNEMETLSLARAAYLQYITTSGTSASYTPFTDHHMLELGRILRVPNVEQYICSINADVSVVAASAQSIVAQLERALQLQYRESYERRLQLRDRGELDARAKMELLAEKIAFEDVIIGRIIEALPNTPTTKTFLVRETVETGHLIDQLQSKLRHLTSPSINASTTSATTYLHTTIKNLTQVFTRHLLANVTLSSSTPTVMNDDVLPSSTLKQRQFEKQDIFIDEAALSTLLFEQRNVHNLLVDYQKMKMGELVNRLVDDTMQLVKDDSCSIVENVSGHLWDEARRRVNEELIQSEVRHVLMKAAQHYEHINSADKSIGFTFTLTAVQRSQIEQWADSVEEHLLAHLEHFITDLNAAYQATLKQHHISQLGNNNHRTNSSSTELLHEYADVIAHIALIDARIETLQLKSNNKSVVNKIKVADPSLCLSTLLVDTQNIADQVRRDVSVAEFKAAVEVAKLRADECVMEGKALNGVKLMDTSNKKRQNYTPTNFDGSVGSLSWTAASYSSSYDNLPELTLPPDSSTSISPFTLNSPHFCPSVPFTTANTYHHQIALLRHAFHQTLATYSNNTTSQPSSSASSSSSLLGGGGGHSGSLLILPTNHHVVVAESSVERLRTVCEQVLVAMERAHRTTLQSMRTGHREELDAVRRDKEQALAEETQATLAALDAMRKAHEAEVVKEVARFKLELTRQQASELLELRERLSVKCLEAAALQEQLGSATRQLAHAHQHILHLDQQRAPSVS